jgi:hypothetical protein
VGWEGVEELLPSGGRKEYMRSPQYMYHYYPLYEKEDEADVLVQKDSARYWEGVLYQIH